ncbi:hypothetical protein INS49_001101 [Diaporthe citri]|uniref:uncharacterized protein n=1 Tax=Diaporthe citri TaxID=83186 RepID=UPI001C822316|nr:uncharacterized protein INS49_001101 [Diaporthe citri]KAG6366920.1 hypothetical protein INS49_001101 [Diaporthe citri]
MDRSGSPSHPPDYGRRLYGDDDHDDTPLGQGSTAAAVRLLTSMEEPMSEGRPYVLPDILRPSPLCLPATKITAPPPATSTPEHISSLKKQEEGKSPSKKHISPTVHFVPEVSDAGTTPRRGPVASKDDLGQLPSRAPTVKLQKKNKPAHVTQAEIASTLPAIPEGLSPRRKSLRKSHSEPPASPQNSPAAGTRSSPRHEYSSHHTRHSYQPSVFSTHSHRDSILDPPSMPPPDSTYIPFRPFDEDSPPRAWSPSRTSDYERMPPAPAQYEPADLNGSPRPGTPSSRYGGSPRRPLPPAPLFSGGSARPSSFADDATVSIPLEHDDDDVFGPESSDMGDKMRRESYLSRQDTLSDELETPFDDKVDHYGPAPQGRQQRRGVRDPQMTRKEVQLINGELVLECKIPTILYSFLPRRDEIEFTHMRYTAVTCDPDDFLSRGYKLRQNIGRTLRETELFICVTMYNEDEIGFTRTMHAVMKNISHFCSRSKSRTWGENGWQKIVVAIVSDGREKIHPRTLDALAAMGVYQHGIAKNFVNQKAVQAHVYEYTTQVSLDSDLKFKGAEKGIVPCQMIFCLKEKNAKKLNSHRWCFNAFGKALNPNVCILLDVGTKPGGNSLYHLWKAFDTDSNVAGACGEIKAMKGKFCLSPDTMVRTTQGPKAIRDVVVGNLLFDHQDNPVQCLAAEAIQASSDMKKVTYTEYNSLNKTSFICTPNHIMTLVAHGVSPSVHTGGIGVMWWTRCDRTELNQEEQTLKWDSVMHGLYTEVSEKFGRRPTDGEVRQYLRNITCKSVIPDSEAEGQEDDDDISPGLTKLLKQLKDMGMDRTDLDMSLIRMLIQDKMEEYLEGIMPEPEEVPDNDEDDTIIDLEPKHKRKFASITLASSRRPSDKTYRQTPELPSSSPVKESQDTGVAESQGSSYVSAVVDPDNVDKFAVVRDQLSKPHGNQKCKNVACKGLRQVSIKFASQSQATLAFELLSGDNYRVVDPCAVKDMELFTMTMDEYLASCEPTKPQKQRKLRLYRSPLKFVPYQGEVSAVPVDPYWFGLWLGDGKKKSPEIVSTDQEHKVYMQTYVDRLNSNRPDGAEPVRVVEEQVAASGDVRTMKSGEDITCTMDCFILRISCVTSAKNKTWNPVRAGLKELGVFGDKSGGIPDCYMHADEDTRLAVIAGLIESNGWLDSRTKCYGFEQTTYEHKKTVFDLRALAVSCGIQWVEKFQHHLLLPRKRLNLSSITRDNRDVRTFDVEDAGHGEFRTIEVSGELYQLADRTVVHNCSNLLNPLVASQNFEYKMSNILDKPLESVFGYITVLPGALSAYRYHALQNDETGHGPLSQYFKGEVLHGQHADVFTANMYLAEDRILCWELVAKRGERWVLKYVKNCTGETDVPDTLPEFISQRRRWLNGAFFAAVYSLIHFKQLLATDHTVPRKALLLIESFYQFIQLIFTYFSLANFYLTFYFVAGGIGDEKVDPFPHNLGKYIFAILRYACVLLIAAQFILSLGNRPQGAKKLYLASVIIFSIIMVYTLFASIYIVVYQITKGSGFDMHSTIMTNMILSVLSTIGLYFVMSFIYLEPWHMFTSFIQYFVLLPSYICTLQVYAFCNTHDVTWGTKGDNVMKTDLGGAIGKGSTVELEMPSEQLDIDSGYDEALRNLRDRIEVPESATSESQMQEDYYKSVRTYMVSSWMIANAVLAMAVSEAYGQKQVGENWYLAFLLWSVAALAAFRALGSGTFAFINLVNTIVEGRVKMSLKVPKWLGGVGSKISDTLSSVGSSVRR